ncbi:transcription cofactor vestigial-like protein 3 [Corythoichthys intestinalis]|uniref:transcription cofactor vestigial-like protein 3 n=1 Tax=Corythoichthys intestinalis TaxID=161448 RepID=UPI0025A63B33|nr:transcription cofactor vestigial-like protein 3 [Corythoichthys intestinalis]XP_061799177.1 transcription cofactor vestigial-like protein 3 [Nerophis lumbriciformis]
MSCLDVMYHQSYGAHLLPTEAYKSTYYNHHYQQQQQQQQRRLNAHSKMHNCSGQQQGEGRGTLSRDQSLRLAPGTESGCVSLHNLEVKDGTQPAGAEYLNSRCILFTYFQGDISDVVDEHFSRALSQSAEMNRETKPIRMTQTPASSASQSWKDGESLPDGQSSPSWSSSYQSHSATCLPPVSVSVHPEFSPCPISLNHSDGGLWAGHVLSQASLQPLASLTDSWTYSLNPQSTSGYPNVQDIYHPHPHAHVHTRHPHQHRHSVFHSYPSHSSPLESRFSPLLLPGVRNQSQSATSAGSSPHSESAKTDMDPSSSSPIMASSVSWNPSPLHGSLELYDSAQDQTKAKSSVWF